MSTLTKLRKKHECRILRGALCDFDKKLLAAAFDNLESFGPLCFNNFSYALREFLRHLLHSRAPKDEVELCIWFKPDKSSDNGITRAHRAKYAIQGGLSDEFVLKKLGVDLSGALTDLAAAQNVLSKYTHIELNTFSISKNETYSLAKKCLEAVQQIVEHIYECRENVRRSLQGDIDTHLIEKVVSDGLDELDEIATHGWTDGFSINEVIVEGIFATTVQLSVYGDVEVGLQYGSDSDVRNDIGLVTSDSFPFKASISVLIKRPLGKHANVESLNVDTSGFYA